MEESRNSQVSVTETESTKGCLSHFWFLIKGFVYSCGSSRYYRIASERKLIWGVVFFLIFAIVITFVATMQIGLVLYQFGGEIEGAYERGELPTIVIQDGIAQVGGPQPLIFEDNRSVLAIDTTGKMDEIDTRSYSQGLLLTRTELHFVNEDGYQVMRLSDLNEAFGNPIVLDKNQVLELWTMASAWIIVFASVGILIWNSLIRFLYIVILGLIIWGLVSLKRKEVDFSTILIIGIFANVPAIYLRFVLKLINVKFFSLYTILLVVIWAIALASVFRAKDKAIMNLPFENNAES